MEWGAGMSREPQGIDVLFKLVLNKLRSCDVLLEKGSNFCNGFSGEFFRDNSSNLLIFVTI